MTTLEYLREVLSTKAARPVTYLHFIGSVSAGSERFQSVSCFLVFASALLDISRRA